VANYAKLQKTAQRLIDKNGRSITLVRQDRTNDNASRPWKNNADPSGAGAQKEIVKGVFVPPNTVRQFGLTALGQGAEIEDLIANSENVIIISPGDAYDVREFQEVIDGTETWGIVGTQILRPADLVLLGFLGVKR